MVEEGGAADIIAGGRLQLGISRGSPEQVIDGWRYFGYAPPDGTTDADMARRHTGVFREVVAAGGGAARWRAPFFAARAASAAVLWCGTAKRTRPGSDPSPTKREPFLAAA